MKALTLTQPWATLVALGAKRFETRSWQTSYRGPLAIHAAKGMPASCRELCNTEPFRSVLLRGLSLSDADREDPRWDAILPRGEIVAIVKLSRIDTTEHIRATLTPQERAFGDYGDGRHAWTLTNRFVLSEPRPKVAGHLSLWEWKEPKRLQIEITARQVGT